MIVKVEVAPFAVSATDVGFMEHVGAFDGAGDTEQVNATVPVNPSRAAQVIVEVADCPAAIELGVAEVGAEAVKSATLKPSVE